MSSFVSFLRRRRGACRQTRIDVGHKLFLEVLLDAPAHTNQTENCHAFVHCWQVLKPAIGIANTPIEVATIPYAEVHTGKIAGKDKSLYYQPNHRPKNKRRR